MARIHIPQPLHRYTQDRSTFEFEGDRVSEVMDRLFEAIPALRPRILNARGEVFPYLFLILSGRELDRKDFGDEPTQAGDEIDIVAGIEGGSGANKDVRMKGFQHRHSLSAAMVELAGLADQVINTPGRRVELALLEELSTRVLAEDVVAEHDVPGFDRSAMDGFALVAEESFSATALNPISLKICGESMPGMKLEDMPQVKAGQACRIMTGARIPVGANAVLKFEDARVDGEDLEALTALTPGKNIGKRGEDVAVGDCVLQAGRRLRPQDLGILASIGRDGAKVFQRPRVAILVTGNELLPAGSIPAEGSIIDSNTPMLEALVRRDGGDHVASFHFRDDPKMIADFLATVEADILLCAGGSSVGREDYLPNIVGELGQLLVHGIAMRPSAPTGFGRIRDLAVFLLPGNPVSCLCAYDFFAGAMIRQWEGFEAYDKWPYPSELVAAAEPIYSPLGRSDFMRVRLVATESGLQCQPIALSGASILSSTTQAQGFVVIAEDSEGYDQGEMLRVFLYDSGLY